MLQSIKTQFTSNNFKIEVIYKIEDNGMVMTLLNQYNHPDWRFNKSESKTVVDFYNCLDQAVAYLNDADKLLRSIEVPNPTESSNVSDECTEERSKSRHKTGSVSKSEGNKTLGFTPETLEFDGIKIEGGDKVCLGGDYTEYTVSNVYTINYHEHVTGDEAYIDLVDLNITAHYPAKDKELERLDKALAEAEANLSDSSSYNDGFDEALEIYYQARKRKEELESK